MQPKSFIHTQRRSSTLHGNVVETRPRGGDRAASPRQGPSRADTLFQLMMAVCPEHERVYRTTSPTLILSHLSKDYVTSTHGHYTLVPSTLRLDFFKVTEDQRSQLKSILGCLSHVLDPSFYLPSRHALTRYITSFFGGFHAHMPFIHEPTWDIQEHSAELVLGIASIGAQYCFERKVSEQLLFCSDRASDAERVPSVETVRVLISLMGFATLEPKTSMVQESFVLQELLTHIIRDEDDGALLGWHWRPWVKQESSRRSRLTAVSFLHTHSIAYNVHPTLRSNEVNLRLPCSTKEQEIQKPQLYSKDALSMLLKDTNESAPLVPIPTPLRNYVLLHGLLQRVHIVRDLSLPVVSHTAALPREEVAKLETAPYPSHPNALLALAYVCIYLHLRPYRQLGTRDSQRIARAVACSPDIERSDGIIAVLLYATIMIGISVRLRVERVARSQVFFWSVRHSLASLECGVLLSNLADSEDRILHWVRCIVEGAYTVIDFDE
ncbi:hypothetical protein BDW75DRAFT_231293 [Aspergillus navahoensis]